MLGLKIVLSRQQCLQMREQASGRHRCRVSGPGEMAEGARNSHGGGNASKVPPGPGFRVYIDRLRRAAGSRSEVVKGPGRPGWQAGQQTDMAGPAPGGGQWRPAPSIPFLITNDPGGLHQLRQSSPWTFSKEKHNTTPKIKKW